MSTSQEVPKAVLYSYVYSQLGAHYQLTRQMAHVSLVYRTTTVSAREGILTRRICRQGRRYHQGRGKFCLSLRSLTDYQNFSSSYLKYAKGTLYAKSWLTE